MNTHRISREQLADLVKNLHDVQKTEVGNAISEDFDLSTDGVDELLARLDAFREGKIVSKPWNDINKDFGSV